MSPLKVNTPNRKIPQDFLEKFFRLGKKQKRILKQAQWIVRKMGRNAHPSQEYLSKGIPCSREHINRTYALFKRYGWIELIDRGRRLPKGIKMAEFLIDLDLSNLGDFSYEEITPKVTGIIYSQTPTGKGRAGDFSRKKEEVEPLEIPEWVQKLAAGCSLENKLKLSLLSEGSLIDALEKAKFKFSKGYPIRDPEKYVVGSAIKIFEATTGRRPEWRRFYRTLS